MAKKTRTNSIDLRQKLTSDFCAALQTDWDLHGKEIIECLRAESPVKYAEIIARLAVPEPMTDPADFSRCQTAQDIGKQLLLQTGAAEIALTDDMIEAAAAENERFVDRLMQIAGGH
jgi:hypothetical protein